MESTNGTTSALRICPRSAKTTQGVGNFWCQQRSRRLQRRRNRNCGVGRLYIKLTKREISKNLENIKSLSLTTSQGTTTMKIWRAYRPVLFEGAPTGRESTACLPRTRARRGNAKIKAKKRKLVAECRASLDYKF